MPTTEISKRCRSEVLASLEEAEHQKSWAHPKDFDDLGRAALEQLHEQGYTIKRGVDGHRLSGTGRALLRTWRSSVTTLTSYPRISMAPGSGKPLAHKG